MFCLLGEVIAEFKVADKLAIINSLCETTQERIILRSWENIDSVQPDMNLLRITNLASNGGSSVMTKICGKFIKLV